MTVKEYSDVKENDQFPESCIIRCPFTSCNTRIIHLKPIINNEVEIKNSPDMVAISESTPVPVTSTDDSSFFFKIEDAWDFDNIGVSRPADDLKQPTIKLGDESVLKFKIERLLVCSECDKGPIGFAGFQDDENDVKNLKYFLSCNSVIYDVKDEK